MFTPETTFHMIARHMLAQKVESQNENGTCVYRGPDGRRCAVGCLIPDSEYLTIFDNGTTYLSEVRQACPTLQLHDLMTLTDMQDIHDTSHVDYWAHQLKIYAHDNGYAWPPPVVALACVEAT